MKTEHLSPETVSRYRARRLTADELLRATEHLAECGECRNKVAPQEVAGKLVEAFGGEHLQYEALEAIVHGGSEGLEHVNGCSMCSAELRDLRSFRASLTPTKSRRVFWAPAAGFAAVAAAILLIVFRPSAAPPPKAKEPGVPADIAEVMRTGRLPVAAPDPELVRTRETLLGAASEKAVLEPLSPVGTLVSGERPVFRWKVPESGRSFRVKVYDQNFELVNESPVLAAREWISDKALPRGKTLNWTVSGVVRGRNVTAPQAPEPEAKFRVASEQAAAELEAARSESPHSELRVAMVAARLGLLQEARAALDRMEAENPGSPLVAQLRASLPK